MYNGHVYDKATGAPLAGVKVSDGRNIVCTDTNGSFSLPGWERGTMIHLQMLTKCHDDWYLRLDGHEGDFDFFVTPAHEDAGHSFLHISDTEIDCFEEANDFLPFLKKCVNERHPAFLIHTGDITRVAGMEAHYRCMNYETMGCPVRYTMGNHDFIDDQYGEYTFERLYGPTWYSFDLGNIHYVIFPMKHGDAQSRYKDDDCEHWLQNDLAMVEPDRKLIFFCHDVCAADEDGFVLRMEEGTIDLKEHNLLAWVFGHFHRLLVNKFGNHFNIGTSRPNGAGIDATPASARIVTILDDSSLETDVIYNDIANAKEGEAGVWRTQLDGRVQFSTPILEAGDLFVGTVDDGYPKRCGIYRLHAETGEIVWKFTPENSIKNNMAYANGKLYAQDSFGCVYCLDAANGALLWKQYLALIWPHYTTHNVVVDDRKVYCGNGRQVYALDAKTGVILWCNRQIGGREDAPGRYILHNGLLLVRTQWTGLFAMDIETGAMVWENRTIRYHCATPLVIGDDLIVTTHGDVFHISSKNGEILEHHEIGKRDMMNTPCTPVVSDGRLYHGTCRNSLISCSFPAYDDMKEFPCGPSIVSSTPYVLSGEHEVGTTPVILQDNILYASADGYLYLCDKRDTTLQKKYHVGAPMFVEPIVTDKFFITADFNGRVTAYKR